MGGGHEAAEGWCVCFAMLGVPLGSDSLTGGGSWIRDLLWRLHHYITAEWCSCVCVEYLWGLPFLCNRINVSTQRLHSGDGKNVCVSIYVCVCVCVNGRAHGAAVVRNWQDAKCESTQIKGEMCREKAVSCRFTARQPLIGLLLVVLHSKEMCTAMH